MLKLKNRPLVLASQSPRRKELLAKCGVPFTVDAADIDESLNEKMPIKEQMPDLAEAKARASLKRHPEAVVIGADTIVYANGKVYGKPKDEAEAIRMLEELSDTTHEIITGYCVVAKDRCVKGVSVNHVHLIQLNEEDIKEYLALNESMDKAGAYAIQGFGGRFIDSMEGDFYSMMGLPVSLIYQILKTFD